jgi:hypothetical protein
MMVALAMPPPSHIVCRPYRSPRCSSALTSVVMMRAPLAPTGWPIAMAPPLTLVHARTLFCSPSASLAQALAIGDLLRLTGRNAHQPRLRWARMAEMVAVMASALPPPNGAILAKPCVSASNCR